MTYLCIMYYIIGWIMAELEETISGTSPENGISTLPESGNEKEKIVEPSSTKESLPSQDSKPNDQDELRKQVAKQAKYIERLKRRLVAKSDVTIKKDKNLEQERVISKPSKDVEVYFKGVRKWQIRLK